MKTDARWLRLSAAALSLALVAGACGGREDDSGSGDDTGTDDGGSTDGGGEGSLIDIEACATPPTEPLEGDVVKIGSSFPQSGVYAPFAEISKGWQAYIDYANENDLLGDGMTIETVTYDDEYLPDKTTANVNKLLQEDDVFALFNIVGTPNNQAVREVVNPLCVPNLYVATGSQLWGQEAEEFPWTVGSIPSYPTEAAVFADYLKESDPDAKVAILYQADDFGEGYVDAFTKAIEGSDIEIVAEESLQPGGQPASAVTTLAASGADTALFAVTTTTCPGALGAAREANWTPLTYISATCTSSTLMNLAPEGSKDNVISAIYLKAPEDPQWAEDEGMLEFKEIGGAAGLSETELNNGIVTYGFVMGQLLVDTLIQAKEANDGELTRLGAIEASRDLAGVEYGQLLPGVTINSSGFEDPYLIEAMQIGKYNPTGKYFELQGELLDFEGETSGFAAGD